MSEQIIKLTMPTPFAVGDVNVYLIKGDALSLIDAGVNTTVAWESFQFQLAQHGFIPEDIDQVILTHHHPDHIGLLESLPDNIPIYAHPYAKPFLENNQIFFEQYDQFYKQLFKEFGMKGDFNEKLALLKAPLRYASHRALTYEINEGDKIPGLPNWNILYTPGHAQSHLSFFREQDGILIAGDHLLATISSNPLLEPAINPIDARPKPQLQYNQSLKKLLDYKINLVYTGHGGAINRAQPLIERRLDRQHARALQVKDMLQGKKLTTYELTKQLFPAVYQKQLGLTLSETTAQLDYLLAHGMINKTISSDGIARFGTVGEK